MPEITITIDSYTFSAGLSDHPVALALYENTPVEIEMNRWGDEYYGSCGLSSLGDIDMDGAREIMEVGELAYWPTGDALCIFFGPTPVSTDDRPRAVSPVIPLGRVKGDLSPLASMGTIEIARVSRLPG